MIYKEPVRNMNRARQAERERISEGGTKREREEFPEIVVLLIKNPEYIFNRHGKMLFNIILN